MMMRLTLLAAAALACGDALNVAVTGATGRTGRLVVDRLLQQGHSVVAIVRDEAKAKEILSSQVKCATLDLATAKAEEMREACAGADRLMWCATGFTDSGESLDVRGMTELMPGALESKTSPAEGAPLVVMLSSAGVTRPAWDDAKKARLVGAADIPIINLNPGGILGKKCEAEQLLRDSGLPYTVVRPTGLKFEGWPQGRPIFSQGDVAVGRTNALDLADVLVSALDTPAATGKTFEMFTLAGYPPPRSLDSALSKLALDSAGSLSEEAVTATYSALQQCLPGEEQDATKLEMGRSYEQVDAGVVARERGAAPTQRERDLAAGVAGGSGGKRQAIGGFFKGLLGK